MVINGHSLSRERHWVCAQRLSERRHRLGLTQCDVVTRLTALGVTASNRTLSAMENGQGVDIGRLPELATALDCTVTYLLGLTDDPARWTPDAVAAPVMEPLTAPKPRSSWILGPDVPERRRA